MASEDNGENDEGDVCNKGQECHYTATKSPRFRVWINMNIGLEQVAEVAGRHTVLYLWVVQHNTLLCIRTSNPSGPWNG
jgi:hypothetical protein